MASTLMTRLRMLYFPGDEDASIVDTEPLDVTRTLSGDIVQNGIVPIPPTETLLDADVGSSAGWWLIFNIGDFPVIYGAKNNLDFTLDSESPTFFKFNEALYVQAVQSTTSLQYWFYEG